MKYLLDANLLCEPTKPQSVEKAVEWLQANVLECVTDVIVIGEIWRGIDKLPAGRKRTSLENWFDGLRARVYCLDWDFDTAVVWGGLINDVQRAGFTVGIKDTMIAATAKHHGLTVATRNVEDFNRCGVPVINPYG